MAENRNGNDRPTNGSRVANAYFIDLHNFSTRLKAFYSHWNQNKSCLWSSADVLVVATPPDSHDMRYLKSSALNIWLSGYEFPKTIMVFMKKQIHFLCSQRKASLLGVVKKSAKDAVGVDVAFHVMTKTDDDSEQMHTIFRAIHAQSKSDGNDNPIVGRIVRETPEGKLLETWTDKLKNAGFNLSDINHGLSDLIAVKDPDEIMNVKKAGYLIYNVMNNIVVPRLENVIDDEKKIAHSSLMDETEKAILEPTKAGAELRAENVDICYPPIFQSGGEFDLRPTADSNDELLYYDPGSVIICAVGSRKNYCSNIARSYLIGATPQQSKAYQVLLKAHEAAISALKPGNKVSAAYQAALSVVDKDAPELVPNLTKSAGTGIGLEFRESGLNINVKNMLRYQHTMHVYA